jgi:putative nucleotidyltransferase-like protein
VIQFDNLPSELQILLFCIRHNPSDAQREKVVLLLRAGVSDERLYSLAAAHGLQMLLYRGLIPLRTQIHALEGLLKRLEQELTSSAILYEFIYPQELADILTALVGAGIDTLMLKGHALGQMLYDHLSLRPYGDFDILIRVEQLKAAEQQMAALGYTPDESQYPDAWYRENHHHLAPYIRAGSLSVEIHWNLVESKVSNPIQIDLETLWKQAQPFNVNGVTTRILCPEHLLIHLSIHAVTIHFFEMGLRPLSDVCALLERYSESLDWERLVQTSLSWRCERQVYLMLRLVSELFEINLPDTILQRLSLDGIAPSFLEYSLTNILSMAIVGLPESSGLAQVWQEKDSTHRFVAIAKRLFPPRALVAAQYGFHAGDMRIWLYYPRWQVNLIRRHFKNALHLLRAEREVLERARYETMRRELLEWLSR